MPPTPLAAPLPEYFLFDEDDSKAVIPKEEKVFDDAMRESLMSRIMLLS